LQKSGTFNPGQEKRPVTELLRGFKSEHGQGDSRKAEKTKQQGQHFKGFLKTTDQYQLAAIRARV